MKSAGPLDTIRLLIWWKHLKLTLFDIISLKVLIGTHLIKLIDNALNRLSQVVCYRGADDIIHLALVASELEFELF